MNFETRYKTYVETDEDGFYSIGLRDTWTNHRVEIENLLNSEQVSMLKTNIDMTIWAINQLYNE